MIPALIIASSRKTGVFGSATIREGHIIPSGRGYRHMRSRLVVLLMDEAGNSLEIAGRENGKRDRCRKASRPSERMARRPGGKESRRLAQGYPF